MNRKKRESNSVPQRVNRNRSNYSSINFASRKSERTVDHSYGFRQSELRGVGFDAIGSGVCPYFLFRVPLCIKERGEGPIPPPPHQRAS
jgi:hypothetical protein